ncbi:unnamed protein product, partial [Amoebophrya sp. A25]
TAIRNAGVRSRHAAPVVDGRSENGNRSVWKTRSTKTSTVRSAVEAEIPGASAERSRDRTTSGSSSISSTQE